MIQYNTVYINLSASQQNKLKPVTKTATEATLVLSLNLTADDETNSPHNFLLADRYVAILHNVFLQISHQ